MYPFIQLFCFRQFWFEQLMHLCTRAPIHQAIRGKGRRLKQTDMKQKTANDHCAQFLIVHIFFLLLIVVLLKFVVIFGVFYVSLDRLRQNDDSKRVFLSLPNEIFTYSLLISLLIFY